MWWAHADTVMDTNGQSVSSHMIRDWQIIWLIPELGLWLLCHLSKWVLNGTSDPVSCSGSGIHYSSLLAAESGCVSVGGCFIYLEAPVIYENQTVFKGIFWVIFPLMFMGCNNGILSITTDNNFDLLLSLLKRKEAFVPQGLKEEAHILLRQLIIY